MQNDCIKAMRETFIEYSRNVINRRTPFDEIMAPTLYSRYEPYVRKLAINSIDYEALYIEVMAASICRACWGQWFLGEKTRLLDKVDRMYMQDRAKIHIPNIPSKQYQLNDRISISEIKSIIRGLIRNKLPEFTKDKALSSNDFMYRKTQGNLIVWLMFTVSYAVNPYYCVSLSITDSKRRAILSFSDMSILTDSDCYWKFSNKEELPEKFDIFIRLLGIILPVLLNLITQLIDKYGEDELLIEKK